MSIKKGTVKKEKFTLDYFSFGNGEKTVVIIPGIGLKPICNAANEVEKRYAAWEKEYTVYVFDHPREITDETLSAAYFATCIAESMGELGLKDAFVMGASHGGMVAQCLAVYYPALVKKLVIVASLARQNDTSAALFDKWINLSKGNDPAALVKAINENVYSKEFLEKFKDVFDNPYSYPNDEEMKIYAYLSTSCRRFDFFDEIGKIKCPVFVIGAGKDRVMSVKGTLEIVNAISCKHYIYENGSHGFYDEEADFVEKVTEFFDE